MTEESYKQQVQDKQEEIEFYTKRVEQLETENSSLKSNNRAVQEKDQQIEILKREINHFRLKIKEMGLDEDKAKAREYTGLNNYQDETNWPRSRLISELRGLDGIIERFTKENEKLMVEKRNQTREIKELQDLLYKESKKVEDYKFKILKETG